MMVQENSDLLLPPFIRVDASTACQLKCPACPTGSGQTGGKLGAGLLRFFDFKRLVDQNPWVSHIELSNWGEVFLNEDLLQILAYAYKRNVALYVSNGANLNDVKPDVLEGLVRYRVRTITCSIDGASQTTYAQYRVNGRFDTVIDNIKAINDWKTRYHSAFPKLTWQFIAFGHNEREISRARQMAHQLNMSFLLKLSWDDLYTNTFSPVRDEDLIRRETGLGVASRDEYRRIFGEEYIVRNCCLEIWQQPQINFDGRVLGCSINYWGDFGNAFDEGLEEVLNSETIAYAREMLMGRKKPKEGIPCTDCKLYHRMRERQAWLTEEEVALRYRRSRAYIMLENRVLGVRGTRWAARCYEHLKHPLRSSAKIMRLSKKVASPLKHLRTLRNRGTLESGIFPLTVPQAADPSKGRKPYPQFEGTTAFTDFFSCHSSVLVDGFCPHLPHGHRDEEILMMLAGQAELILPGMETGAYTDPIILGPGQFVYYPAQFLHTLKAVGGQGANYLMFKWYGKACEEEGMLPFGLYDPQDALAGTQIKGGFNSSLLFEGPTSNLGRLHCHVSILKPGAGYPAHADPYDVAIVVLEGVVETLDQRVNPSGVVFCRAGEEHGMCNPGSDVAKYVVFEFHGR